MSKSIYIGDYIALVDDEDYPVISRLSWVISRVEGQIYPVHFLKSTGTSRITSIPMHYMLIDTKQGHVIKHKDRNTFNNQKNNLARISYRLFRAASAPKGGTHSSKYKGVGWNKAEQKWVAECDGKRLGRFDNEEDAAGAYDIAAFNAYGEWAYQNLSGAQS